MTSSAHRISRKRYMLVLSRIHRVVRQLSWCKGVCRSGPCFAAVLDHPGPAEPGAVAAAHSAAGEAAEGV